MLRQDHHDTTLMDPRPQMVVDCPRQSPADGNETAAMRPNEPLGDEALHRMKAPDVLRDSDGLKVNRINQIVVEPTLQTTRDPDIFAIGDCAACPRRGEPTPVPPRAQAAHQEAAHMVRQIERRLRGEPLLPYTYRDFGSLVSLGGHTTVGSLMGFLFGRGMFIEGLFARVMYRSLRMLHERALHGTPSAVLGTRSRALSRRTGPQVKLH
jgi:NADH:ubiquinone reductase (H+-translocating)